ncbi:hypothetical protein IC619_013360 [Hazenella sp. IB182353]|uniref:hypothetical protein n=1 Tax=Polycladospora coralii TaxID=2771432 RepID=UPI0017468A2B|nr:hypothetical protein [Polycladospora coralii]MBS7531483.1 hypothetical protein [Polycladospora coralii]
MVEIEHLRLSRRISERQSLLTSFPYDEAELDLMQMVLPVMRDWSDTRKLRMLELFYRLMFEMYVYGFAERKRIPIHRQYLVPRHTWLDVYQLYYEETCTLICSEITAEFDVSAWLEPEHRAVWHSLFDRSSYVWFVKGAQSKS